MAATTTAVTPSLNGVKPGRAQQQLQTQREPALRAPLSAGTSRARSTKHRSSNVFWIKLNFTVKAARLQSLKRHKYQHLQEEALLKARGLLKNWEDGPVLLIEDLYRQATSGSNRGNGSSSEDAQELLNYTPEALALRFSLRNNPAVLSAVKELWTIDTGPRDALGCIDQRAYTALFRRIAKCVDAEAFPRAAHRIPKRMEQTIHEDWKRDSKGENQMSFANFFDSVFELADLWCETIHEDEYALFLRRVRDRISEKRKKKKSKKADSDTRVLRPMKKVRPLDEDDSEEEEDSEEDSEASTSEGSEEVAGTKEELQTEPVVRSESSSSIAGSGFAHISMVHRFLTVKSLDVKSPSASHQASQSRIIHSATGSHQPQQQPRQRHHQQDVAGRFVAVAQQQQLVQRQSFSAQRKDLRSSVVTTLHFGDDSSERIALVTSDGTGDSNGSDLSGLVAGGTSFQPSAAATPGSRGNSLSQMKPIQADRTDLVGLRKNSGDVVIEARPRTPTVAVHVVESGINGIFNSSKPAGDEAPTAAAVPKSSVTKTGFAPATRHAILSFARPPNRSPLLRDVVFNAMNGKTEGSQMASAVSGVSDASNFGSIVGSQLHTTAAPAASVANAIMTAAATPYGSIYAGSHSISPAPGSRSMSRQPSPDLATKATPAPTTNAPAPARRDESNKQQHLGVFNRGSYSFAAPADIESPSSLRPSVKPRIRQPEAASQRQQQKKRMLPPMSPVAQFQPARVSPYRLVQDDEDNGADPTSSNNNNYNLSEPVDLSTSYQTTSYATDPSSRAYSNNPTTSVSANSSSSRATLDPYTKSATSANTPLWYGLRPTKEPRSGGKTVTTKRARTPAAVTTASNAATRAQRIDIGGERVVGQPKQRQQQSHFADDLDSLHASPWDTYEDGDTFDSDFLVGRDWQSFSPVDEPPTAGHEGRSSTALVSGSSSSPKSRDKQQRQQQRMGLQLHHSGAAISGPEVELNTKSYATTSSLIVISLASSSPAKLSHSFSVPDTSVKGDLGSTGGLHQSASSTAIPSSDQYQGRPHASYHLTHLPTAPVREIKQLHISTSPLHQHEPPPRNASREKGLAGWREGVAPAGGPDLELRGERRASVYRNPVALEPDGAGLTRPNSPIRSKGCSRSEKKNSEDCASDHCEAAACLRSLQSASSSLFDVDRPKSPVFKMEKRRATMGVPEGNADELSSRELLNDVTILLNARRELILRPKQSENDTENTDGLAKLQAPTRSEMMKRRYKYTFGRT